MKLSKGQTQEYEENPTFNAWASFVTAVSLNVDAISSDTQFAMLNHVSLWRLPGSIPRSVEEGIFKLCIL